MASVRKLSAFRSKSPVKTSRSERNEHDECYLCNCLTEDDPAHREGVCRTSSSNVSRNVVDFIHQREHGIHSIRSRGFRQQYGTQRILRHNLLNEKEFSIQSINKVFCAKWLSDRQVVFGTKCNKLLVLDLLTSKIVQIPNLISSNHSTPPDMQCGIHSIQINPSWNYLATGAYNANDVAIYKLPSFDPVAVGEGAHKDWIFDVVWLDDEFFVTGSRDTKIALWRVPTDTEDIRCSREIPLHSTLSPVIVRNCKKAEKVRALAFNEKYQELVALSLNAYLHIWDVQDFRQKISVKLHHCFENVCLASRSDFSLYAVGSKSHLTIYDSRNLRVVKKVPTANPDCSIRSVSFCNNIITLGTGVGTIMFYDCCAGKYLEICSESLESTSTLKELMTTSKPLMLQSSWGWMQPDEMYREIFHSIDYNPAIYTHCYDPSGTKLFAAGGPLPCSLSGMYAGLWL